MRKWIGRLCLIVVAVAMVVTILEVAVRWAKDTSLAIIEPDPYIARKTRPTVDIFLNADGGGKAHVKTNKFGFVADYDWEFQKPPGTFRIASLGDSFTAGHDVDYDENYTVKLAEDLPQLINQKIESLNFAVPGQGTAHQLATYEYYAKQFNPDAIVIWFFTGNDFEDNLTYEEGADSGKNLDEPILKRLARRSELALWSVNRLARIPFFARLMYGRVLTRVGEDTLGSEVGLPLSLRLAFTADLENDRAFAETKKYFAALQASAQRDGTHLMVVIVPTNFQVEAGLVEKLFAQYPQLAQVSFDPERPNRELARILDELTIDYFDLTPGFRETCGSEPNPCSLYLCPHCHLSVAGHERASELVVPALAGRWFKK